jgi:hypothetical protein
MKPLSRLKSRNFATTVGVLIVAAVFGLAIGLALFVQNEAHGHQQIWPLSLWMK